jgi:methylated-DNA-[protein]-cysteine S-methyltransferase
MNYFRKYNSPVGVITLAGTDKNLTGLWIEGQNYFPEWGTDVELKEDLPVFKQTIDWLERYFRGENPGALPPVAPEGTEFRKQVWKVLEKIPYGELTTYGEIAKQISKQQNGKFISPRAVGGAVGHNPICIIIPCHRVIGSDGSLTGYAGGMDVKVRLLETEGMDVTPL